MKRRTFVSSLGASAATGWLAAATYPAAREIRLAWTDAAGNESAYRLERSPAGREQWTLVTGTLAPGTTTHTDTGLVAGTSYDYRISAVGAGGLSGYASVTGAVPLDDLEFWRQTHFGGPANAGPGADDADPDADGIANLVEYALGSIPVSAASATRPAAGIAANRLTLTFTPLRADVVYQVRGSPDLLTWSPVPTPPPIIGSPTTVSDTVDIPAADPPRRFLRLEVTAP